MHIERIETPLGIYSAVFDESAQLRELSRVDATDVQTTLGDELRRELEAYFAGTAVSFSIAIAPQGTPFQRRVWAALREIPFGQLRTYAELARTVERAGAARAVGGANGANPIAIVIPCHRVVAANGILGGYTGGVGVKRALLEVEGHHFAAPAAPDSNWSRAARQLDQLALSLA